MTVGPDFFTRAVDLLEQTDENRHTPVAMQARATMAQAYATLAQTAAIIETADLALDLAERGHASSLAVRPYAEDPDAGEPAYPGTPWGRALYRTVDQ